jgi:formylmethanofuran dehydrogenase subunit E
MPNFLCEGEIVHGDLSHGEYPRTSITTTIVDRIEGKTAKSAANKFRDKHGVLPSFVGDTSVYECGRCSKIVLEDEDFDWVNESLVCIPCVEKDDE